MLIHAKGNLLDMAEQGQFDVIVHGCNCQHVMGSGIAKEIKDRYIEAYRADSAYHDDNSPIGKLGNFSVAYIREHDFYIVNAYTQIHYLPRGIDHFQYESFFLILIKLSKVYPSSRFGFPYIGMGLAGGNKDIIMGYLEGFAEAVTETGGSATLVEFES